MRMFEDLSFVAFDIVRSNLWNNEGMSPSHVRNLLLYVRTGFELARDLKERGFSSSDSGLLLDIEHPAILTPKVTTW